jgi:hypothetical protein
MGTVVSGYKYFLAVRASDQTNYLEKRSFTVESFSPFTVL